MFHGGKGRGKTCELHTPPPKTKPHPRFRPHHPRSHVGVWVAILRSNPKRDSNLPMIINELRKKMANGTKFGTKNAPIQNKQNTKNQTIKQFPTNH